MRCSRSLLAAGLLASLMTPAVAFAQNSPPPPASQPEKAVEPSDAKAVEVFEAAMKAMGGRKALEQIETMNVEAEMKQGAQAPTVGIEMQWGQPVAEDKDERLAVTLKITQFDMTIKMGSDGTTSWAIDPMNGSASILGTPREKQQIEGIKGLLRMNLMLRYAEEDSERLGYIGTEKFNDVECHKVRIYPKDEDAKAQGGSQFVYFSTADNLPSGFESDAGPNSALIIVDDYKKVGDLMFFHSLKSEQGPQKMALEYKSIKINSVADSAFALPAAVKDLVSDSPTSQPNG